jgi:hypothetical protein
MALHFRQQFKQTGRQILTLGVADRPLRLDRDFVHVYI